MMDTETPVGSTSEIPDETTEAITTEWTVMAYMAGDNNLNEEMVLSLQEMVAVSEIDEEDLWPRIRIVAQLDPSGMGLPSQRYVFDTRLKTDQEKRYVKSYLVDFTGEYIADVNTGNPAALSGFVKWAVEDAPDPGVDGFSMLILSGHGSGSTEAFLMKDDNPVDSLSIPELEEALILASGTLGKKIDLLGMDCCFMSMVEVCYQIREHVEHVVGAESMVPDFGWPYHRILARAMAYRDTLDRAVNPDELTEIIVREFIEYYSDYDRTAGRSVDLAWIHLLEIQALKASIDVLGAALNNALDLTLSFGDEPQNEQKVCQEQIVLAHWEAQTYKFDQFVDLRDFCVITGKRFERLEKEMQEVQQAESANAENAQTILEAAGKIKNACADVVEKLADCVMLSGCSGFAYQHSYGLSIYFPWAYVADSYQNLAFAKTTTDTGEEEESEWMKFLNAYVLKTRREIRVEGAVDIEEITSEMEEVDSGYVEQAVEALGEAWSDLAKPKRKRLMKAQLKHLAHVRGASGSGSVPGGSRYHRSRYHRSRYHRSRWPGDREKSVKNFTPAVGTAYLPPQDE